MRRLSDKNRHMLMDGCKTLAAKFAAVAATTDEKVKFPGWDYEHGLQTEVHDAIRAAAYAIYNNTDYDDYMEASLKDLGRLLSYIGDMVDFA